MSRSLLPAGRLTSRILSSVTIHQQCVRTAATLKYFHPKQKVSNFKAIIKHAMIPQKKEGSGEVPPMPPYPYGPNRVYPDADTGLYGGRMVQSGNKISKGRNKGKTLRRWYPNVRLEKLRSEALDEELTLKVTAHCMRTIRKCGGLDPYLLGTTPARIKELGILGWALRWRVMTSPKMQQAFAEQRVKLGLSPIDPAMQTFEQAYQRPEVIQELRRIQMEQWRKMQEKKAKKDKDIKAMRRSPPTLPALESLDPVTIADPEEKLLKSLEKYEQRKRAAEQDVVLLGEDGWSGAEAKGNVLLGMEAKSTRILGDSERLDAGQGEMWAELSEELSEVEATIQQTEQELQALSLQQHELRQTPAQPER